MAEATITTEERNQLREATARDLEFTDHLESFDKTTLAMMICQLTSVNKGDRDWVLNYCSGLEYILKKDEVIHPEPLIDAVLNAVKAERLEYDAKYGPISVNPRTIDEWLDKIHRSLTEADSQASMGADDRALSAILKVARDAVAALEERIGNAVVEGTPVLKELILEVTNKTADDADTSPAENVN